MPNTDVVGLRRGDGGATAERTPPAPPERPARRKASSPPPPPAVLPRLEGRDRSVPYRSPSSTNPFDRPRRAAQPPEPPEPPAAPDPYGASAGSSATEGSNGDHRAADEVYSFLSSFTAGVQRGLDEANDDDDPDPDDPHHT